jgi:hypothetical protein
LHYPSALLLGEMKFHCRINLWLATDLLNLLLMCFYVWADYGRGYLAEDPSVLNSLYQGLAFAYVADGAMYLYLHEGELPWPSGFSMWSDWLSFTGNCLFAATSCMYPMESSEAITTAVLVMEALASLLNVAAAICGFAGWWMESALDAARVGCGQEVWGLLTSLDAWTHITNFLPAVVYIGSSVAAAEINYTRLADLDDGTGAVRLPELLRNLSRVYWYGDILWTINALFFLAANLRDQQFEHEQQPEGHLEESLLSSQLPHAPTADSAADVQPPSESLARKMHKRRRRQRQRARDAQPYHLYFPFLRWFRALCGSRESYLELRGSHLLVQEEEEEEEHGALRGGSINGPPKGSADGSSASGSTATGSTAGSPSSLKSGGASGGMLSGKRVLKLIAVTTIAANATAAEGARARKDPHSSSGDALEMTEFSRWSKPK